MAKSMDVLVDREYELELLEQEYRTPGLGLSLCMGGGGWGKRFC